MFKTLTAALIAASLLVAPGLTTSAQAGQSGATLIVKPVKFVTHRRHAMSHKRFHRSHARHHWKHGANWRHGKFGRAHRHSHVFAVKPRIRAN